MSTGNEKKKSSRKRRRRRRRRSTISSPEILILSFFSRCSQQEVFLTGMLKKWQPKY
jgi:hypothetical protein